MSTQPSHRSVAAIRPTNTPTPTPASPHTPVRTLTSTFASPSTLRAEEDTIVIELGARFLRVGLAGDALPKAKLEFGPERRRRAGDFRQETTRRPATEGRLGEDWELWAMDLRGRGLGVVGDRIESALREAFTKLVEILASPGDEERGTDTPTGTC